MSWPNAGHQHCVDAPEGAPPRRFLGPVVLDADGSGLIPVVDILAPPPARSCENATACTNADNPSCVDGLCCMPAGGAFKANSTFCCPGAWWGGAKCCHMMGAFAQSAAQCCTGKLVNGLCAPPGEYTCLNQCKSAAAANAKTAKAQCKGRQGDSARGCKALALATRHYGIAYCYSAGLPSKC